LGEMAQPTYGTHRVKNPGLEDGVWITDGKNGFEIPESRYRENGYKPRVEELPWRSSTWEGGNARGPRSEKRPAAQNWHRQRATDSLDGTRDRRVLV
jgi:hypothetical protein